MLGLLKLILLEEHRGAILDEIDTVLEGYDNVPHRAQANLLDSMPLDPVEPLSEESEELSQRVQILRDTGISLFFDFSYFLQTKACCPNTWLRQVTSCKILVRTRHGKVIMRCHENKKIDKATLP